MKLSARAWERSIPVIQAIKTHSFNQELKKGILDRNIFAYYIEQDSRYLEDFSRCHAIIAAKAPTPYIRTFLHYSEAIWLTENTLVHGYFRDKLKIKETKQTTPATLNYTNYLLRTAALEPFEIAIAAVLPCFWVYHEVGRSIIDESDKNNPYARWIETYSGEDFGESVDEMIQIFDEAGECASEATQEKMLDAFNQSTWMEWHFWNDAYHKREFINEELWSSPKIDAHQHSIRLF